MTKKEIKHREKKHKKHIDEAADKSLIRKMVKKDCIK